MSVTSGVPARADVVVVGAGPAGAVVARRLAEAGAHVILLEAGAHGASPRAGLLDVGPGSEVVARYRATLGHAELELPRGRTLGGSGAVNGGYCTPARPADLEAWGPDWPRRYAVGLARASERLRPGLSPRGPLAARVAEAFPGRMQAIAQARRGDRRVTAVDAWDPAGAGARVITGAPVRGLRWEGGRTAGRCVGVILDDDEEITARRVVLCAGSIGTAALLLASGIGPSSGHPVGRAVQEHPEVLLDLTGPDPEHGPDGPDVDPGPGPGPGPGRDAGSASGLPPLLSHVARLEIPLPRGVARIEVRPYSVPLHRVIPGLAPQPHRIGIALMNPRGRGEIAYVDGVGGTRGAVGPGPGLRVTLSDDPHDAAALVEGARLVADRLGIAAPVGPVPSTSQHLTGSAAIGEVVDDSGRVLGVAGLRVADASVFPSIPGCGPYYSVLAVAEDLASRMIEQGAW